MATIKTSFLLSLTVAVCFIAGCRKDAAMSGGFAISKVKTAITTSSTGVSDTFYYAYDSAGRLIRAQTDTVVTTYSYTSGSIVVTALLAGESFLSSYTTNALGLAIADSKSNVYSYDSAGYLIALSHTGNGNFDSTIYIMHSGDIDTTMQQQEDAASDSRITTVYSFLSTRDSRDYGMAFLGKQNVNLISAVTISQNINGSIYTADYNYSYTYDARGRVAQQIETTGSATYSTSYTYY